MSEIYLVTLKSENFREITISAEVLHAYLRDRLCLAGDTVLNAKDGAIDITLKMCDDDFLLQIYSLFKSKEAQAALFSPKPDTVKLRKTPNMPSDFTLLALCQKNIMTYRRITKDKVVATGAWHINNESQKIGALNLEEWKQLFFKNFYF